MKNDKKICSLKKSAFLSMLIFSSAHAYEPILPQSNPADADYYYPVAKEWWAGTDSIMSGDEFINFNSKKGFIVEISAFYFNSSLCAENGSSGLGKAVPLVEISIPNSLIQDDDIMGTTFYQVNFIPKRGGFSLTRKMNIKVSTSTGAAQSKPYTYEMQLLDTFDSLSRNSRSTLSKKDLLSAKFCNGKNTGKKRLSYKIYVNEYNTLLVIKNLQDPAGLVYSSPIRIGYGTSIHKALNDASKNLDITIYHAASKNAIPSYSPRPRIFYRQIFWSYDSTLTGSKRNLEDDFNVHYGARNYPIRSPLVDRAKGSAGAILSIINAHGK